MAFGAAGGEGERQRCEGEDQALHLTAKRRTPARPFPGSNGRATGPIASFDSMEPLKLNVVFYWVTDVDMSLPFYRDFGLEPGSRFGDWQELQIGGTCRFAIHGGRPATVGSPSAQVSLEVADLDAAIATLAGRGHEPVEGITDTGYSRFTTYADPDGNLIQVLAVTG